MTIAEMIAAAKKKREDMQALVDTATAASRELTAEEAAQFDTLKAEHDATMANVSRAEALETMQTEANTSRGSIARGAALPGTRAAGDPAVQKFENFGHFMAAVRFKPNDQRLNYTEGGGSSEADFVSDDLRSEQRMDVGTSGGYMVPTEFRNELLSVPPEEQIVRPLVKVKIPAGGSSPDAGVTIPSLDQTSSSNNYGGVEVVWINEGDEKPETGAALRDITLTPHEVAGLITITDKLLRNWQSADALLKQLLRGAISAAEDHAFIRGNGVNKPQGVLNSPAAITIPRTTANLIKYADVVAMVAKKLMRGGTSSIWIAAQSVLPQLTLLVGPDNQLVWKPDAVGGFAGTLLGYPLKWNNRSPALGTKGDLMLIDWSIYLIKDGSGPFVAASEHVLFKQNKTVIKAFWNVDGQGWLTEPITEENGYTVSPFIILGDPAA